MLRPYSSSLEKNSIATITSLLYPGAGVVRGLNCIAREILVFRSRFRRDTELQQAAVAGGSLYGYPDRGLDATFPVSRA